MKRFMALALAAVMMTTMMVSGVGFASEDKPVLGYVVQDLGNQFWVTVAQGIKDRAKELGVEVIVLDARTDPARQLSLTEDLLQRGIDALLISPWDADSGGTAVEAANRKNVPVVVVDIGVDSALKAIRGEKLPETIYVPVQLITKDNVDKFLKK